MIDDKGLREQLQAARHRLPDPPLPSLDRITSRARVLKARRFAAVSSLGIATTAAILVPLVALSGIGRDRDDVATVPPPRGGQVPSELPDVGVVICDESGTRLATERIRPQPDGVHFRTDNRTDGALSFQIDDIGGTNAPPGLHEVEGGEPWSIAPGTVRLRCQAPEEDAGAEGGFATMTIEDPGGLWVPDRVECQRVVGSDGGYRAAGAGSRGDPLELAREQFTRLIRPGDEVRKAGYPQAPDPTFALVREGKTFATVQVNRDGQGGWFVGTTATCSGGFGLTTNASGQGWVAIGTLEQLDREGVLYLAQHFVFVVATPTGPLGLSALTLPGRTDLVSRVLYCGSDGWFYSHHGIFDHLGFYRYGPANKGLDRVEVQGVDDQVLVNVDTLAPGPPRSDTVRTSPPGPSCEGWEAVQDPEGPPGFIKESLWGTSPSPVPT